MPGYYDDKTSVLRRIFSTDRVCVTEAELRVGDTVYPIVNDVIVLLPASKWPEGLRAAIVGSERYRSKLAERQDFSEETQFTFGVQWNKFSDVLVEHDAEFRDYFDLVDMSTFGNQTVCDLGCGMGRWSYFLAPKCRNIILVDFSDAIFAARRTLKGSPNALFFMGDITALPFSPDFADFLFCLGVLHHIPVNSLTLIRDLERFAPRLLIYLYYALENRPFYFRSLFYLMSFMRRFVGKLRDERSRATVVNLVLYLVYVPCAALAGVLPLTWAKYVPLHAYSGKSVRRIRQDVYDKLLTRIEQRFTRDQILELRDTFETVAISEREPYWHFLCERAC